MKIVLQRVKEARVDVEGRTAGRIGRGLCLLVGVEKGDAESRGRVSLAKKTVELRIFPDADGKMNLSRSSRPGRSWPSPNSRSPRFGAAGPASELRRRRGTAPGRRALRSFRRRRRGAPG